MQRNERYFKARVTTLDFSDPSSVSIINKWASDSTQGLIPSIIARIAQDEILFLMNAVYFKGLWQYEFDSALTQLGDFKLLDGSAKKVPMMRRWGDYAYVENAGLQVIRLPYGSGRVCMFVLLPPRHADFSQFVTSLDSERFNNLANNLRGHKGLVVLPRFKVDFKSALNPDLAQLGMGLAFDELADFSEMVDMPLPLSLSRVIHKAVMTVDEKGTEAAAVTSVGVRVTAVELPFEMKIARSFVVAIRDTKTGELLFLGAIIDPQ